MPPRHSACPKDSAAGCSPGATDLMELLRWETVRLMLRLAAELGKRNTPSGGRSDFPGTTPLHASIKSLLNPSFQKFGVQKFLQKAKTVPSPSK